MEGSWTHHANLVRVHGVGALILGDTGSGKTCLSIELARRGWNFIADDAVRMSLTPPGVVAAPDEAVRGLMAPRGCTITKIPGFDAAISNVEVRRVFVLGCCSAPTIAPDGVTIMLQARSSRKAADVIEADCLRVSLVSQEG